MNQKTYTIGRMAPADIIVSGPGMDTLSRRHASITASPRGGGYYQLVDLDSSNGTFVNRGGNWIRIHSAEVHETDSILLGKYCTSIDELLNKTRIVQQDKTEPIDSHGIWERDPYTGVVRFRPYGC